MKLQIPPSGQALLFIKPTLLVLSCCLVLCHIAPAAPLDAPWLVVQSQNEVSAWLPEKALPKFMVLGTALEAQQTIMVGSESFCVLGNASKQSLMLSSLTSVIWNDQALENGLLLQKGSLKLSSPKKASSIFCIKVPYGVVATTLGSFNLFLKSDKTALLDLFAGEAEVRQGEQTKVLLAPKLILIEKFGLQELSDPLLPRRRTVFDFREKPKDYAEAQQVHLAQKSEAENGNQQSESEKSRGKASNAKLVAGQADGEGEYHWDISVPFYVYLLPLVLLLFFSALIWSSNRRDKNKALAPSAVKKNKKDHGYESVDVLVWRGNLTANDPVLETTKTTHILGNVEDGAKIVAQHDLLVMGCFQGAHLVSTHSVTIESGINGQGKAYLDIAGELHTAYISEAQVICREKVVVEKAIRNAQIACDGDIIVQSKNILGGWVASATCVITPGLGSDFCETKIILGQPAPTLWKDIIKQEPQWTSQKEFNRKASLRVMDEIVSVLIEHGSAKLDQKKALPGPVETRLDPSDLTKLQIRGFRKDEEASSSPASPPQN